MKQSRKTNESNNEHVMKTSMTRVTKHKKVTENIINTVTEEIHESNHENK